VNVDLIQAAYLEAAYLEGIFSARSELGLYYSELVVRLRRLLCTLKDLEMSK